MAHQRAIFSGGPKKKEELMEACEMWVASQQYVQAIDAYLSISVDQISDLGELEELWAKAIELCAKHDPSRYKSIVEEVASRLLGMSRFDSAAEHFQSIDKMNEALDCYLRVNNWVAAQSFASSMHLSCCLDLSEHSKRVPSGLLLTNQQRRKWQAARTLLRLMPRCSMPPRRRSRSSVLEVKATTLDAEQAH